MFSLFSVTKAFTNILVFQAIERGLLTLTTPIAKVIPEFAGGLRDRITIFHLLTHSAGLPTMFEARPGMYIDRWRKSSLPFARSHCPIEAAGMRVAYAPLFNHALLGEAVRRLDPKKRSYREILHEDLFDPLGMKDTSMGVRRDLKARHLIPEFRGNYPIQHLGHSNLGPNGAFEEEDAEMPWVGCVSTAHDMMRFAEMLRGGGTLDGRRIVSRAMVEHARTIWTGDKPNEFYASGIRAVGRHRATGEHRIGFFRARPADGHQHVWHPGLTGHVRCAWRRHHDFLDRSRTRHQLCRSDDRPHEHHRQPVALAATFGHRARRRPVERDADGRLVDYRHRRRRYGRLRARGTTGRRSGDTRLSDRGGRQRTASVVSTPALVAAAIAPAHAELAIFDTVPQAHLNSRQIPQPRGKVVGGSGSINGMVYSRGNPRDYDDWAAAGATGWNYANVLPYFTRSENNQDLARLCATTGMAGP